MNMSHMDTYTAFLDGLRESGVTNMFGAVPYLRQEFPDLTEREAKTVLVTWMKNFGKETDD